MDNLVPPSTEDKDTLRPLTPTKDQPALAQAPLPQWRLFGAHLNSFVVYVDPNTALLRSDDFYGKLSSTVLGGYKLVRGYAEGPKPAEKKDTSRPMTPVLGDKEKPSETSRKYKRKSMPATSRSASPVGEDVELSHRLALERRMNSFVAGEGEEKTQDEILETEMKEDYKADEESDDPARDIEHLLLVTHGIGQKLSMRMESVNFVHDVNVFRKALKSVYGLSPDLQVLNDEVGEKKKNCKVQCLPVCASLPFCPTRPMINTRHRLAPPPGLPQAISPRQLHGNRHLLQLYRLRRRIPLARRHNRRGRPRCPFPHDRPRTRRPTLPVHDVP